MKSTRAQPLSLSNRPSTLSTTTEATSQGSRGLIIAALHLVFVSLLRSRPRSSGRRSCGGPAIMIMHPVNSGVGVPGMGGMEGVPGITGTDHSSLSRALVC